MRIGHVITEIRKGNKVVANAMMCAAEKEFDEIKNNKNVIFWEIRIMKKDSCDITGGNRLKDKNGKIVYAEDDRRRV